MKNKLLIYKILLTIAVLLALISNTLPIISAEAWGFKLGVSAMDFFKMDYLETLGEFFTDTNYIAIIKGVIVGLAVLNLVAVAVAWLAKTRILHLIEILAGVLQVIWWGYVAINLYMLPQVGELVGSEFLHGDLGLWGYLLGSLLLSVSGILLFVNYSNAKPVTEAGALIAVSGEYAGARIPVGEDPVVIGRDQSSCNVILHGERISRQHCSVVYDSARKLYIVRDFSSNGTFLGDGRRMASGQANELTSGEQITIEQENVFMLQ